MGRRFGLLQELLGVNEAELMSMLKSLAQVQLVVEESADQFAFRPMTRAALQRRGLL